MNESDHREEDPVPPSTTRVDWPGIAGLWHRDTPPVVDNDDYVSTYDHLSSIDDYIDAELLDKYAVNDEHLQAIIDNFDPAKLVDRGSFQQYLDDPDDHDCADVDDYCLGIDDDRPFKYFLDPPTEQHLLTLVIIDRAINDYYAGRDDGPGLRSPDPSNDDRPLG